MAKKLYKKTGNNTYEIQGILPTETEWGKVVLTDTNQTITGTKTFDVAYANVFATGEGEGNYFQCRKFRGEGDASTYYHALEFGYAGHNQWDFFEYGGIYNFYRNTTSDGSGKVNLFQISPDGVTSHKQLIAESTLTAKGAFTSSASTTLSHIKNAGILGTDSSGKVCDNSSKYQKAGDYATKSDLTKYQPAGSYQPKGDYVTYDNASKDVYLGSHGIYSGTRPSSGSATLKGNGYWIKPSYVGVSSSVVGGTVPSVSSEMTPDYVSVSNGKIKLNSSGIVSDLGTFTFDGNPGSVATSADLKNYQKKGKYVTTDTAQTITGMKTFNSPANVNGQEVATAIFKTSNGGRLIIGKEGPNSGTMLRFDQTEGTTRLQFRASATPGAMVWTQPEKGATLYFDLTNSAGASTRTTLDARSGTIARTSDIKNKKITIQKNGTEVGSFTTNPSSDKTINISLSKNDVGLGNVDNTADKNKNVKHASIADDSTNAFNLVSSDKQTKYTAQDFLQIYTDLDTKMRTELHDLSYGIFFRNSEGLQYTGIDSDIPERRMIATFDNTTNPNDSDHNIGSKMVDLGTVMSAGVDSDDPQNFGGAIFANFIGPNNSVGKYSDILRKASQVASDKFRETHGANLDGGFGCLAGTAKGSLFTSRIDSNTGDIYTSALMFKPNVDSNDPDFQGNMAIEMKMPCFSIYNGIQVTTSGPIYDRNDAISPFRDINERGVAFLAYSKTGQNVDIDRITKDYQLKGSYVTTNTEQTISSKKTFSTTPVLSALKNKKVLGTDANGLIEAHTLGISDISNLQSTINGKANVGHTHAISEITNLQSTLNGKQATLVSGTNIKTINGNSILGSGNLSISADLSLGYDYEEFNTGFYNTQYDHKNLLNLSSATIQGDSVYKWGTVINVTPNDKSSMVQFYVSDGVGRDGYNHRLLVRSGWGLDSSKMANWQKTTAWEQILTRNTCPKAFTDIINSTITKSAYCQIGDLLIQWGVFIGAHGDTTNWTVTYPKTFYWYPSVILQTKDTNTSNQGIPYSNGAVITNYNNGTSFTFQLRRSESCPVYWIAIGGLS